MQQNLLVFSHLRWDFVYQRPQQLLSRLARRYSIFFLEEPVPGAAANELEVTETAEGILVCRPHSTSLANGFHDDHIPAYDRWLGELSQRYGLDDAIAWFYSPMALPLAQRMTPRAVIYDCMDDLTSFLHAPKQLRQRENALLKMADVVFTGGQSLYRAKRDLHQAVYCFPSSVDPAHFGRAKDPHHEHPEQRSLPGPRLGYFGVIDERIDLELISWLADAHPEWQIVMVGPVVKIDPDSLPRRPNIHYFGQRSYDELPQFLAGWDLCLLPFALNHATRYISPTKTLEYMAGEKPIVSTPITDVVEPYGDIVSTSPRTEFVAACERALGMTAAERERQRAAMRATVERTSWDRTAAAMSEIIDAAVESRSNARSTPAPWATAPRRASASGTAPATEAYETIVIGAGPTGLSAAYHLGKDTLLLERNSTVGGLCRSFVDGGYTFDYAGHIMFSNDPYVHELYHTLLGENVHWQDREAFIFSKSVYTRYPFQGALHGLPPDVLKECIIGAIEARFGSLNEQGEERPALVAPAAAPRSSSTAVGKPESITDCCADGSVEASPTVVAAPRRALGHRSEPKNFEEFIYRVWGAGVAKHFAVPYNRKLWAVPLAEMETSWLGGRVPMPNLEEMIDGALRPVPKPVGPNARFGYPLRGGFQALMNGFLPLLDGELRLDAGVAAIDGASREVALEDGSAFRYRKLISTMPLPALIAALGDSVPEPIARAAAQLRHVSVRCVNLGIARAALTEKHWIYYPEDTVFHRVFVQGNASPHCNPPGGFALTCEITYAPSKPLPCDGDDLIDRCIQDCIKVGLFTAEDMVTVRNQVDMPCAYVVYDHARKASVDAIRKWLLSQDIILAGRYAEWEYYNSDHAFIAGKNAAEAASAAIASEASADAG